MDAEAEGFAQFVEARRAGTAARTAWLLTGDWAVAEGPGADGAGAVVAAVGGDQAA